MYYCTYYYVCQILSDLIEHLHNEHPARFPSRESAATAVDNISAQVRRITGELFAAFENEYSIFCPMSNCFELFGLDFMVDDELQVFLLEVNPGPDFKQTGTRLRSVIVSLWEQVFRVVIDKGQLCRVMTAEENDQQKQDYSSRPHNGDVDGARDFALVYSKEWSVSKLSGGMNFLVATNDSAS